MVIRRLFIHIWHILDPVYSSFTRLQPIIAKTEKGATFRVRLTKYRGKDIVLSDGTKVCKNDMMLKIHLYNVKIMRDCMYIKNELTKGRAIFKRVKNAMPHLAEYIQNHPQEAKIKGIVGITMINKGFLPLGFECVYPTSKFYAIYKKATHIPIFLLSNASFSRGKLNKHQTVYLMMSKDKLLHFYGRANNNT
ncbi:YkoP family protein [Bacillus testis]|uniref:YkoP family protein n=1 Tax=Bacillus testis TaxID=1622072 RepID=UPI00067F5203|nr:hypothetical protein [Bacillus testis]